MQRDQDQIDNLDAHKRYQDAAKAIDEQVVAQQHVGGLGFVFDAFQSQRDQRDDDEALKMTADRIAECAVPGA